MQGTLAPTIVAATAMFWAASAGAEPASVMRGAPPDAADQVTLMNAMQPPFNAWTFRNLGIFPSVMTPRGDRVSPLPPAADAEPGVIEAVTIPHEGGELSLLEALAADNTDGYIVLKDGKVVYERYFGEFGPKDHHLWASVTKSMMGMAAGLLVEDGALDLSKPIAHYLPELQDSAFGRVTVRQTLDMSTALDFSEDYANLAPGSVHLEYFRRLGLSPAFDLMKLDPTTSDAPRGVRRFLSRFEPKPDRGPDEVYEYQSPNADVIGWVIERVSGQPLQRFVSERIWGPLGAQHDAFFITDVAFTPVATGGFSTTLRDFARFGLAVLNDGQIDGRQVFPAAWSRDIAVVDAAAIDRTAKSVFRNPDGPVFDATLKAYKNFWWIQDPEQGIYTARGVFGQLLYVNRAKGVVIASFGSAPTASNAARASFRLKLAATHALAESL